MSEGETKTKQDSGYLVHLFVGEQNTAELAVLQKIAMKFGLTAWDQMTQYLPWRNRAALRTTMCRIIRKQALSEYDGIRADPIQIQKDNDIIAEQIQKGKGNDDYLFKGGVLVNARWDRSPEEWAKVRKQNSEKYEISEQEAKDITIPSIISIDYMRQQCFKRRESLLVRRAALLAEKARRMEVKNPDLKVDDLQIRSGRDIVIPAPSNKLSLDKNPEECFFKPTE
ncbi:hypothetical protein TVAG_214270 [Trichomonas vaginalis G3]|uniref:Uncharacterized protein n=1 Tax=Trichomonas vaginalis (strain ATCC PRA-98 / G3) TaxID=412133 RepID=A2DK31_TRIV3|nr:ubiquitin-associated/translation elongation factor EF1bB N-terminal, eukaryote family [Trichomonas vaginalis G3]EAY19202.1 hypothetical protein TVAG_214270 [Trichomonas vaginalis G3]KAI5548487.1 ubiquitin-associated/translation elongation factor EF1bB N-terminal, eukaryote family [Trichomonas vaginalis G3]|eukprot:XP_001580188.1 hypothetical protein [Trichomonas vaginalis G3]